jgi:GNAT superfamily N-acetyltransferase
MQKLFTLTTRELCASLSVMAPKRLRDGSILTIRNATEGDVALILSFIRELAKFEKLEHEVVASEAALHQSLFGPKPYAEVLIAERDGHAAGFALFFHSYSTFLAQPGIYLEDLFVRPDHRGLQVGEHLLTHLAQIAVKRGCGRLEWSVLDWNEKAIRFYEKLGARERAGWLTYRLLTTALDQTQT